MHVTVGFKVASLLEESWSSMDTRMSSNHCCSSALLLYRLGAGGGGSAGGGTDGIELKLCNFKEDMEGSCDHSSWDS